MPESQGAGGAGNCRLPSDPRPLVPRLTGAGSAHPASTVSTATSGGPSCWVVALGDWGRILPVGSCSRAGPANGGRWEGGWNPGAARHTELLVIRRLQECLHPDTSSVAFPSVRKQGRRPRNTEGGWVCGLTGRGGDTGWTRARRHGGRRAPGRTVPEVAWSQCAQQRPMCSPQEAAKGQSGECEGMEKPTLKATGGRRVVVRNAGLPGPPLPALALGVCGVRARPPPISAWMLDSGRPGAVDPKGKVTSRLLEHSPQASSRRRSGPVESLDCAQFHSHVAGLGWWTGTVRRTGALTWGGCRRTGAPHSVTATGFLSETLPRLAGASRRAAPPFLLPSPEKPPEWPSLPTALSLAAAGRWLWHGL